MIEDIAGDAAALKCGAEVEHCRTIVERGSSAEFQLRAFRDNGDDITAVSRWIADATISGTSAPARTASLKRPHSARASFGSDNVCSQFATP